MNVDLFVPMTRLESCGCWRQTFIPNEYAYIDYHPSLVEWRTTIPCDYHLREMRRRTVLTMVTRRNEILANARRSYARRRRYEYVALEQQATLTVGLRDNVTGEVYSFNHTT